MKNFRILLLLPCLLLASCKAEMENKNKETRKLVDPNEETILEMATIWNKSMNMQGMATLRMLYASEVFIYGKSMTVKEVISSKEKFFRKHADFTQTIAETHVTKVNESRYKVSFSKRSTYDGKSSEVPGYLIIDKMDKWRITTESDEVTDRNLTWNEETQLKFNSCEEVVFEILKTSPEYIETTKNLHQAIVDNGGMRFELSLEGSPDESNAENAMSFYSDTYDFRLQEIYPDRSPTIARYKFDLVKKQLYVETDELRPIAFNRKLLSALDKLCH